MSWEIAIIGASVGSGLLLFLVSNYVKYTPINEKKDSKVMKIIKGCNWAFQRMFQQLTLLMIPLTLLLANSIAIEQGFISPILDGISGWVYRIYWMQLTFWMFNFLIGVLSITEDLMKT